jgi:YggT family protein
MLLYDLVRIIEVAFRVLELLIIARVILSWIRIGYENPIVRFIYEITEPILAPIRKLMPGNIMIDFSPLIAILILQLIEMLVFSLLL